MYCNWRPCTRDQAQRKRVLCRTCSLQEQGLVPNPVPPWKLPSFSWALLFLPFNEIETQERASPLIPWLLIFLLQPLSYDSASRLSGQTDTLCCLDKSIVLQWLLQRSSLIWREIVFPFRVQGLLYASKCSYLKNLSLHLCITSWLIFALPWKEAGWVSGCPHQTLLLSLVKGKLTGAIVPYTE